MADNHQNDDSYEWIRLGGGAPVAVDDDGDIVMGCPGLEGHNIHNLDETRDEREQDQEQAEAAGWESNEQQRARAIWESANHGENFDPDMTGRIALVKVGDTYYTFEDHADQFPYEDREHTDAFTFDEDAFQHHKEWAEKNGREFVVLTPDDASQDGRGYTKQMMERPAPAAKSRNWHVHPSLAEHMNDMGMESPQDREMFLDLVEEEWNRQRHDAATHNDAYLNIVFRGNPKRVDAHGRDITKKVQAGHELAIRNRFARSIDPENEPGYEEMADFIRRHYPWVIGNKNLHESEQIVKFVTGGKRKVPAPHDDEVVGAVQQAIADRGWGSQGEPGGYGGEHGRPLPEHDQEGYDELFGSGAGVVPFSKSQRDRERKLRFARWARSTMGRMSFVRRYAMKKMGALNTLNRATQGYKYWKPGDIKQVGNALYVLREDTIGKPRWHLLRSYNPTQGMLFDPNAADDGGYDGTLDMGEDERVGDHPQTGAPNEPPARRVRGDGQLGFDWGKVEAKAGATAEPAKPASPLVETVHAKLAEKGLAEPAAPPPTSPAPATDLFGNPVKPPTTPHKPATFDYGGGKETQGTLIAGLDALPGQMNLFADNGVPDDMVGKGVQSNEPTPMAEEPPADKLFTIAGLTLDQAAKLAEKHGHENAADKIKNRPSAWADAIKGWQDQEKTEQSQQRRDSRAKNWKPNEDQQAVLDAIGGGRTFLKSQDMLSWSTHKKAMEQLVAKGVIDRTDSGREVSYRLIASPKSTTDATAHNATTTPPPSTPILPHEDLKEVVRQEAAKKRIIAQDFGEKIGGARKDVSRPLGPRSAKKDVDPRPAWARRYKISRIDKSNRPSEEGKYAIYDLKDVGWSGQPRQKGDLFDSEEAANKALPLLAVARNHSIRMVRKPSNLDATNEATAKELEENAGKIKALQDEHQSLLTQASLSKRYKEALAQGKITQDLFNDLQSKGRILSDEDEAKAAGIEQQIRELRDIKDDRNLSNDGEYEIYRTVAKGKYPVIKGGFSSKEEAMAYLAGNAESIIEHQFPTYETYQYLDEVKREGKQRRSGDVDGKKFQSDLGFRAGEFGNWQTNKDGQISLNHAYDALHDMADLLGFESPKDMSLDGKLAIAFGARGTGGKHAARAHYERDKRVMNLTKMAGAGSLAHEWAHALDHHISGSKHEHQMASEIPNGGTTPEVKAAIKHLVETMTTKDEEFVEDATKANIQSVAAEKQLAEYFDRLEQQQNNYSGYGRKPKSLQGDDLKRWNELKARAIQGDIGEKKYITPPGARNGMLSGYETGEVLDELNKLHKKATGRSFHTSADHSTGKQIFWTAKRLQDANKKAAEASQGTTKKRRGRTNFMNEAIELDKTRAEDYYTQNIEMLARAFEAYIADKLHASNTRSDYLVGKHKTNNAIYRAVGMAGPFPEGDERIAINKSFDNLIEAIKNSRK